MIIHHRLTIHPKPLFPRSVSSKNGVSHNIDPADMVGLTNMSDYDISVNKSATLAGQDCDVTPLGSGMPCSDGDPNTLDDACDGQGTCVGTLLACTPGSCETSSAPLDGVCVPSFARPLFFQS